MQSTTKTAPKAWTADQARQDVSWIQHLSAAEAEGFDLALQHARGMNKPMLAMEQADFPLTDASRSALARAIATTQTGFGMCLVKGFPVDRWSEADTRLAYWGMGLYMGVGRTQNRASQVMNDVRDEGGDYKAKGGRGYNTNAGLDFHQDSCDVVGLLCRRTAKSGGTSKVISSMQLCREVQRLRPDLMAVLQQPFFSQLPGHARPVSAAVLPLPDFWQSPRIFCGPHQPQKHRRRPARFP